MLPNAHAYAQQIQPIDGPWFVMSAIALFVFMFGYSLLYHRKKGDRL